MAIVAMSRGGGQRPRAIRRHGRDRDRAPAATGGFGARTLRLGDCGNDVKTLHWVIKADSYGVSLNKDFDDSTQSEVQSFQKQNDLSQNGVVGKRTRKELVKTMPKSRATWYGMLQQPDGVRRHPPSQHDRRRAPQPALRDEGRSEVRKPLRPGPRDRPRPVCERRRWDLTQGAAKALHFTGSDEIRAAPIRSSSSA